MPKQYQAITAVDVIGSASTMSTLTASYTDNKRAFQVGNAEKIGLLVKYTPNAGGAANSYVSVLVEVTSDGGTNYFPFSVIAETTTEMDVHDVPFIVPGDKVSAPGVAEYRAFWIDGIPVFKNKTNDSILPNIRISVKESVAANFGTVWISLGVLETL